MAVQSVDYGHGVNPDNRYDVAVVGAGPAGSATASILARRGLRVVLIDRARFPRDKACAEYCSPGVEDVLRRIGAWPRVAREKPRRVPGMTIWIGGRPALPIRYEESARERLAFTLPRLRFDHALLQHAEESGATVLLQHRTTSVRILEDGVSVLSETRAGEEIECRARACVGADGMNSIVARSVGARAKTHWPRRLGLITHYEGVDGVRDVG